MRRPYILFKQFGMQYFCEQFKSIYQPRAGAAEKIIIHGNYIAALHRAQRSPTRTRFHYIRRCAVNRIAQKDEGWIQRNNLFKTQPADIDLLKFLRYSSRLPVKSTNQ